MMVLDLAIVSDSAVVHIARARPVWVMLPLAPDWRWLLGRGDSASYPTMRLYRQRRLGAWDEVIERVAGDLAALRRVSP
ncbi:MAG TPA: hypothetical protein VLD36_00980 [Burkholderiales bacterium]|jgi:hypothetical protein|nr:hypothetical protein [Burkholderiales bacterium]